MRYTAVLRWWAAGAALLVGTRLSAQQANTGAGNVPDTGQVAPDFTLPGAVRYGLLRDPVRLSDFRGQTVVLAFFVKARTRG